MKLVLSLLAIVLVNGVSYSQTCDPPRIVANTNTDNIFSPEQEMVLGELTLQRLSREFRPVRDAELLAYIEEIGQRLLKKFPVADLKYTFHIIEHPDNNAFNTPGGHVFLTRKLISFANSEDELASVIAHELGHAAIRHGSQDISAAMKAVLNVTSLGDRADVIEKYNRLIENARTKRAPARRGHQNEQQLEADKLGFFAMVAAGYDPNASFTFFDRLTESEGKTGNWFSDLFGNTRPEQKRLREIAKATEQLPQSCRDGRAANATENFLRWQADVVRYRDEKRVENVPGLIWKRSIDPKIRSDVSLLKFSTDGKMLLAVDDSSVTVVDPDSAKTILQIPTSNTANAFFTANNSQIVLITDNLRFERWDIAAGDATEIRELSLRRDCWEEQLSPDGKYLACIDQATNINVIDTRTGQRVFERKKFYPLSAFEYFNWLLRTFSDRVSDVHFFRIGFSPDSKFVIFSRSERHRFRFRVDNVVVDRSENTAFAVDLKIMKQADVGGDMKKVAARPYAFIDSERIIGSTDGKLESGGIFSFPSGKRLKKMEFGAQWVRPTANSNFLTLGPLADASIGIYDVEREKVVGALNKKDIAVWNDRLASEAASGKIVVDQFTYNEANKMIEPKKLATVDLPVGKMTDVRSAEVSEDFSWAALSTRTRGGVWNLKSGERKVFTRGFLSAVVDNTGASVAQFPKFQKDEQSLALLNPVTGQGQVIRELPSHGARQYGRFLLKRTSTTPPDKKAQASSEGSDDDSSAEAEARLRSDVKLEIVDWLKNSTIWSRDFKGRVPRYSFDSYSGRLVLYWSLASEEGKARLALNPDLKAAAEKDKTLDSNFLIDVVDSFAGKNVGSFILETGRGSFGVGNGISERDWLVLNDSQGRVLVYSLSTGELRHRFFGSKPAINPISNHLLLETFPGDVSLIDLDTGEKINDLVLKGTLAFSRFSLDGKRLFLFSNEQTAYAVDLSKVPSIGRQTVF